MVDAVIDTSFDVRSDARGRDPDSHSKTLRRYHQLLWSKPLPSGECFDLDAKLHHVSSSGDVWLASDAITNTYRHWGRPRELVQAMRHVAAEELTAFYELGCTVGAYVVFPLPIRVDGRWRQSINQRRGTLKTIRDRFDLTLECIRRHYEDRESPLADTLNDYRDFFSLFGDFGGYVDHFLLGDLVDLKDGSIKMFIDGKLFEGDAVPSSAAEYREYMRRSMDFLRARNARIDRYARDTFRQPCST